MTPAEEILWQELRGNKIGVHFRRQQIIAGFIVDYYCHKAALVVEVDGDIHDLQQEEDAPPPPSAPPPNTTRKSLNEDSKFILSYLGEAGGG